MFIATFEHFTPFCSVPIVDFESGKLMIYLFQFGLQQIVHRIQVLNETLMANKMN